MTWLGVLLAVLAAGGFATAAVLQAGAVRAVGVRRGSIRRLVRDRRWLGGLACLLGAAGFHAVALALAPLSLVQPIGVLALVGSAGYVVLTARRRPRLGELVAVGSIVAGVAGFVLFGAPASTQAGVVGVLAGMQAAAVVTVCVSVLVLAGLLTGGLGRCLGFAGAGAACYALVSVLTRVAALELIADRNVLTLALLAAGAVIAALVGGWLIQNAYAAGSAELVLACQTVGDPAVAVGIGVGVLAEASATGVDLVAQMCCAALAVGGIALLARDRAVHGADPSAASLESSYLPTNSSQETGVDHEVVHA